MIVYVETNLLVEIALDQEQAESARRIVDFAKAKRIQLVLPAISIAESYWAISAKAEKRQPLLTQLVDAHRDLSRSAPLHFFSDSLRELGDAFLKLHQEHLDGFRSLLSDVLRLAHLVELGGETVASAMAIDLRYGQGLLDSMVLASVHAHITEQGRVAPKLFTTRDRDLFGVAKQVLVADYNCTCIPSYDDSAKFIEARTI